MYAKQLQNLGFLFAKTQVLKLFEYRIPCILNTSVLTGSHRVLLL